MSNDKDSKDPGPDDDGWGSAGESEAESVEETPAPEVSFDPVHVEDKVAAMHASRSQVEEAPASPVAAVQTVPSGAAPVLAPATSVDAAQWMKTDPSAAAPSSDMLAAADAVAKLEAQPAAKKRRKREKRLKKDPRTQLTRRQQLFLVGGAVLLVVSAVCAVLGWMNSKNYYLVCGKRSITAEQGSFWPYGRSPLPGEAFKAIAGTHECKSRHFETRDELERAFLTALVEQAHRLLSIGDPEQVATAEQQLQQALLLSRDPERSKERAKAERLQGDVSYYRGVAEVQSALKTLRGSTTNFDDAAKRGPRHSRDSNAWADHARFVVSEIEKGPRASREDESAKDEPHFEGVNSPDGPALPTNPDTQDPDMPPTPDEPAEMPSDAGVDAKPPEPPADAALPTGGVLL